MDGDDYHPRFRKLEFGIHLLIQVAKNRYCVEWTNPKKELSMLRYAEGQFALLDLIMHLNPTFHLTAILQNCYKHTYEWLWIVRQLERWVNLKTDLPWCDSFPICILDSFWLLSHVRNLSLPFSSIYFAIGRNWARFRVNHTTILHSHNNSKADISLLWVRFCAS